MIFFTNTNRSDFGGWRVVGGAGQILDKMAAEILGESWEKNECDCKSWTAKN